MQFHLASDVAKQFIEASERPLGGAYGFNLGAPVMAVADVAQAGEAVLGIFEGDAAYDAVDLVTAAQQPLRKIGAVLAGNPCYQCLCHSRYFAFLTID